MMGWAMLILLAGAVIPGLCLAPVWLPALWGRIQDWRQHDPNDSATILAETALALLKAKPEEWECDGYDLKHPPSGMTVWIANEDYGIKVSTGGSTIWGKGSTVIPRNPERRALAAAYKEWRKVREEAKLHADMRTLRDRLKVYQGGKADAA